MTPRSPETVTGRKALIRRGFHEIERAQESLASLGDVREPLLAMLGRSADPDQALAGLVRLMAASDEPEAMRAALADDEGTAMRLLLVLGASQALTDHLVRHPEQWRELCDPALGSTRPAAYAVRSALLSAVGADPLLESPMATLPLTAAADALRVEYRRHLLRLASRDLAHHVSVDDAAAELSDLAAATLDAALAVARARVGEEAHAARLAVLAMGKCGAHELNYVSDVDVIFVAEPAEGVPEQRALRVATQLAAAMMQICSDQTAEGTIWPVDANLRPEGRAGPLVRTLASHRGYYERWAKTWEFQALLKARPVAGDVALGRAFVELVEPMVWSVAERDGFVDRRPGDAAPGRRAHPRSGRRSGSSSWAAADCGTSSSPSSCSSWCTGAPTRGSAGRPRSARWPSSPAAGYVGREDGDALGEAYALLRTLEHRMQLFQLRRIHVVPEQEEALRRLGRSLGYLKDPVQSLDEAWNHHRREVRRLHEKLFYRPLLEAVARIPGEEARLSPEAARQRLAALGYQDPSAALRHLEALTSGVSRTAAIQRTLLPAMLEWFADATDPDAGLFGFRRISEALGRDAVVPQDAARRGAGGAAAGPAARPPPATPPTCSSASPRACGCSARTWTRSAARRRCSVRCGPWPAGRARPRTPSAPSAASGAASCSGSPSGDLLGLVDVADVGAALSRLTDATLEATLEVVEPRGDSRRAVSTSRRPGSPSSRWAGTAASSWPTPATPT